LNYKASLDFGRTKMKLKGLSTPVETFRVDLRPEGGNKGVLAVVWEKTKAYLLFRMLS
jgi:hypothetical protein